MLLDKFLPVPCIEHHTLSFPYRVLSRLSFSKKPLSLNNRVILATIDDLADCFTIRTLFLMRLMVHSIFHGRLFRINQPAYPVRYPQIVDR